MSTGMAVQGEPALAIPLHSLSLPPNLFLLTLLLTLPSQSHLMFSPWKWCELGPVVHLLAGCETPFKFCFEGFICTSSSLLRKALLLQPSLIV